MARAITSKMVQVHWQCVCGRGEVYSESVPVRWKDINLVGVIRKKDATTKKPFLLQKIKADTCHCHEDDDY